MPAYARKEIVREGEVGIYHCTSRCVRQAFLCGWDPVTQLCFDHRKEWVRARLEQLSGIFAVEVCGYAVLGNHCHVIARTRPDIVDGWSDQEVARRCWQLFPKRKKRNGEPAEPKPHELKQFIATPEDVKENRRRLSSLSWFMRCLNERIARLANEEDGCRGRFWEGRFHCTKLLDAAAVLACSIYVDLNPIRAAICDRPEEAEYTSAFDRICAHVARRAQGKETEVAQAGNQRQKQDRRQAEADRDGWLCAIGTSGILGEGACPADLPHDNQSATAGFSTSALPRRASDEAFLPISLEEYLELLDWTGRQVRADKRGAIPASLAPILERLQVAEDAWLESVRHFGRWFHRAVGRAERLAEEAARSGKRWFGGLARCRQAFT